MAAAQDLARPVGYECRPQFWEFHNRSKRWAVIVAHRRAGKTVACVMELLTRALATGKPNARYAYIAPYREQAKTVAWEYLKKYAQPVVQDPEKDFRESELAVNLINGSKVRLFGADNPNALRGIYLDGVVLDEYADMRPALWGEVIRPALSDRKGWAVFIGTPRGRNEFWRIYTEALQDQEWYTLLLKASETKILDQEELDSARKTQTENQYLQEYECSFEAAVHGAIYPKELMRAREQGRIAVVPYEPAKLVSTAWDLGVGDDTAIWFYQWVGGELRVIDFYANRGEPITHYMSVLAGRGYQYDTHWLPHDAEHKNLTGGTVSEVMSKSGNRVRIVPKLSLEEGINAARLMFPKCHFDEKRCYEGLEALAAYRWDTDKKKIDRTGYELIKSTPVHDWSSHAADAFRYLAVSLKDDKPKVTKIKYDTRGYV